MVAASFVFALLFDVLDFINIRLAEAEYRDLLLISRKIRYSNIVAENGLIHNLCDRSVVFISSSFMGSRSNSFQKMLYSE